MKFKDAIATHRSASKGPDAFNGIHAIGKKILETDAKGPVRSAMILLIAAGYVTVSKHAKTEAALFQATPELTPSVSKAARAAARRFAYDSITPKISRAKARAIIKDHVDHPPTQVGPV